uniref:Uncharacterized protein n=1 Tax=Graphocephala atropunctata TaxID=36148 RepID=A0A1B6L541_9HEMI
MREVIVFGVLCVFALVAFTEIAGVDVLDSQEIQDEGTREGQNLTSSQLKDIDYDLDTPRGPVNSSNPPTAPSPNGKDIEPTGGQSAVSGEPKETKTEQPGFFKKMYGFCKLYFVPALMWVYIVGIFFFAVITNRTLDNGDPKTSGNK